VPGPLDPERPAEPVASAASKLAPSGLLQGLLESRRFPCLAVLLAVALVAPSVRSGWFLDDLWHRAGFTRAPELSALLGKSGEFRGPMRMYAFWDGDRGRSLRLIDLGVIPWWSDPSVRISFWRPLSALTHVLDYRLWPEQAAPMHVQSVCWLALLVALAGIFYRQLFGAGWPAGLATLVFSVSECHAMPAAWLANRHALVGGCFVALALLAHVRGRVENQHPWRLVAWLAFGLALLASEAGVVALAYLCGHALVLERGPWRVRLASLAPYAAIAAVWRVTYTSLGHGVSGSPLYVDPGANPVGFLLALIERAPLLAAGLLGFPADAYLLLSPLASRLLACGATLALLVLGWLTRPLWRACRLCRFFALAALLAILPLCAAMPGSRNLGLAALAAAGLVAQLAANAAAQRVGMRRRPSLVAARVTLTALLGLRLVWAPLAVLGTAALVSRLGPGIERTIDVRYAELERPARQLVLVNPPSSLGVFFLLPDRLLKRLPPSPHTRILAPGTGPVAIDRAGPRALLVRPLGGYCLPPGAPRDGEPAPQLSLDNVLRRADAFLCGERRITAGATLVLTGVTVRVMVVTDDGRAQTARFDFDRPLEDPALRWLVWDKRGGAYERWIPPAEGGRVTLD